MFDLVQSTFLDCFKALVLGLVQGITEFIPVSSSAHLKVVPILLGWDDPGVSFSAALQLGSLIALIIYFYNDLSLILRQFLNIFCPNRPILKDYSILGSNLIIGSLPISFIGIAIKYFFPNYSSSSLRGLFSIGIVSLLMAVVLYITDHYFTHKKQFSSINTQHAFFIGLAQVLAFLPGASRSGVTISAALSLGFDRKSAARFSFLLGIPAVFLSGTSELHEIIINSSSYGLLSIFIGIISATISSLLAIRFLLNFLESHTNYVFILYRIFFGSFLLFHIRFL